MIVELYDPDEIILFGSYAKENETISSDMDFLIIKQSLVPRYYRGLEIREHLKKYPLNFDLLFYTPTELLEAKRKKYSFIQSILVSGKSLYKRQ